MDELAVLVLNYTFEPLHFTNAKRAITILLSGKAESVEASPRVIRSPSTAFPLPAVIRLAVYIRKPFLDRVAFNKKNILRRDGYACQYCNRRGQPAHGTGREAQTTAFRLQAEYEPRGDQPQAIERLTRLVQDGRRHGVLLGVTGSGKTFTMANVIANIQRPTLVISPNKTLAAQLFGEFKAFFPDNAAEYFVSYYDYYQPEAYIPQSDTYVEKDALINDEIDRMRHSATRSLMERRDVIVVASVSFIYGTAAPETYQG